MISAISQEVRDIIPELIAWRRHIHENPELSFEEVNTTAFIEEKLRSFGITEIDKPTKTGLIAHIYGTKPGTPGVLAIRADIDALPMPEKNDLPFASKVENVMHACGHDGHTAMLLATAKLLFASRGSFCGEARLIFQHAEELPPGGAIEMQRAGVMEGADAILGLHLSSEYPLGAFCIKSGALTSNVDRFDITMTGKGGHCALPESCIDPIVMTSELVMALQTVVSRRMAGTEPAVLSICQFNAGTAYNIIPGFATLSGTTRTFSKESRAHIEAEIRKVCDGVAQVYGGKAEVVWSPGYPSVYNDPALTQTATEIIRSRFGEAGVHPIGCLTPGEDFSYFHENCPGFFADLGTRSDKPGTHMPHHNSGYIMDEDALPCGVQYEVDMVRALLDGSRSLLPRA